MWLARKAISPSTARHTIISASPEKRVRVGVTSSNWVVAMGRSALPFEVAGLLHDAVDAADIEERLLGDLVEIALDERFEGLDGLRHGDIESLDTGEDLGHEERLREEALDLAGARYGDAVVLGEFVQ